MCNYVDLCQYMYLFIDVYIYAQNCIMFARVNKIIYSYVYIQVGCYDLRLLCY